MKIIFLAYYRKITGGICAMRFKKWIPGVMLGAMMAAKVTVPVMADNINSGRGILPVNSNKNSTSKVIKIIFACVNIHFLV